MLPLRELFPAGELFPSRDEFSLVSRRLPSVRDILLQHWYEQHEKNKQQCLLQYSEHDERFFECSDPEDMRTGNSVFIFFATRKANGILTTKGKAKGNN